MRIGRIWNVPINVHWSWFVIFALVTWSLSISHFADAEPGLSTLTHWLMGGTTALLLFVSVLLHELGHVRLAQRNGIPVRNVTLFLFGGVAVLERDARTPGAEFRIAIAGPIVSLALSILFGLVWLLEPGIHWLGGPSGWLAGINVTMLLFNLIPGYPLDGGRVLRSIVWKVTNNEQRSTRFASVSGQVVAFGFIGLGAWRIVAGDLGSGIWLMFIGWFLQSAAAATGAGSVLEQALRGVAVGDLMDRGLPSVPSTMTLQDVVHRIVLTTGEQHIVVSDDGTPRGLLTLRDITRVPRADWARVTSSEAMTPWDRLLVVHPATTVPAALGALDAADVAQAPVAEGPWVLGIFTRRQVQQYLRLRTDLGV